jgi:hypothetical protein
VTGFGTRSVGTECFPVFVGSNALPGDFSNNVVENCVILDPAKGNRDGVSLISVGPFMGEATGHDNVARNNKINLIGNDFLYSHGALAQVIESNLTKGCSDGVYTEPPLGGRWRVVVRNNDFIRCARGVSGSAHVGSITEGYLIEGNRFTDCPMMVFVRGDDNLVHYREVIVRQNRFSGSRRPPHASSAVYVSSTNNATVTGNVIDSAGTGAIQVKAVTATVLDNKTSKGQTLDVIQ